MCGSGHRTQCAPGNTSLTRLRKRSEPSEWACVRSIDCLFDRISPHSVIGARHEPDLCTETERKHGLDTAMTPNNRGPGSLIGSGSVQDYRPSESSSRYPLSYNVRHGICFNATPPAFLHNGTWDATTATSGMPLVTTRRTPTTRGMFQVRCSCHAANASGANHQNATTNRNAATSWPADRYFEIACAGILRGLRRPATLQADCPAMFFRSSLCFTARLAADKKTPHYNLSGRAQVTDRNAGRECPVAGRRREHPHYPA